MPEKRYQVFISSTYIDLVEERSQVMQALLELDCMPAGMELFPASDESQWELITRVIDECDYYILILAGRYGSLSKADGISYTEKEYKYALSIGKPTIAFLHSDPGKIIAANTERDDEGKRLLSKFRESVQEQLIRKWDNPGDLRAKVTTSLVSLMRRKPGIGWVRANEIASVDATREILLLRKENESLRQQIQKTAIDGPVGVEELSQGDDEIQLTLTFETVKTEHYSETPENHALSVLTTWNKLFASIAPTMIHEATDAQIRTAVAEYCTQESQVAIQELLKKGKRKKAQYFVVSNRNFQTVKVQLKALGLIQKSEKNRSVRDTETYWSLTAHGESVMTRLRAVKRNQSGSSQQNSDNIDERD